MLKSYWFCLFVGLTWQKCFSVHKASAYFQTGKGSHGRTQFCFSVSSADISHGMLTYNIKHYKHALFLTEIAGLYPGPDILQKATCN